MAFNLKLPRDVTNLSRLWGVQTNQHLHSPICMTQVQSRGLYGYLEMMGFLIKLIILSFACCF